MSQDLDARFSVFLNPIRDLTKNWEVDIAKYLEEYLEELSEVQITFNGGETVMNFAQAAMLIQGSATVYSKKVEFLWQMVLQMLDLLSSRQKAEGHSGAGAGKEAGGGNKATLEISVEFSSVDNITEGRNIDLRNDLDESDIDCSRKGRLRFLPATPLHLVEKEGEKARHRVSLQVRGNEVFGAKDDYRLNRSYLIPQGVLCMEVPTEILRRTASPVVPASPASDKPLECIDNAGGQDDDAENKQRDTGEEGYPATTNDSPPPPEENKLDDAADVETNYAGDDDQSPAPDLELPEEDQEGDNDKINTEEEKKDKEKEMSNNNNLTVIDLPNRYGLRRRGGDKEAVVPTLKLTEPWKPVDPHAETPAKRPLRAVRLRRPPACACHRPSRTLSKKKDVTSKKKSKEDNGKKSLPPVEAFITGELAGNMVKTATKNDKVPPELLMEVDRELAKRLEVGRQQQVKDLVQAGSSRNVAEAMQKLAEETEIQQQLDRELDDPLDGDGAADLDCENDEPGGVPLFLPDPHNDIQMPETVNKRLCESQFDEPASDYEALVQKWVSDYITSAQEQINSSDLARRVNKWRDTITPKLQEEENRQEFDIHRYGSQVLSHFPNNGRKQTIPFSDTVQGQDAREVSRHFLSCLMLANTHNIELSESCPGDLAMDCLELTLLSRVRHHEELQEYHAPSQLPNPKRKGPGRGGGSLECAVVEKEIQEPNVCADITHTALANHNLPSKHFRNRPKVKSRPR
ncbi:hypothetical protein Pcinc_013809 [Petrolisthes cinctipes]|uniref:Condensin-2 complex subunit H2 n=1 Tax=Petrolisthes cinctipes TaxID=88211 RepID=A0AAE1FXU4_PETCI|nr:hypothetical protein Pcinc_013809 [Petrolisthes cinctipes]